MYQEVWDGKHYGWANYTRFDRDLDRVGGLTPGMLLRARLVVFFSGANVNFIKAAHLIMIERWREIGKYPIEI